MADSCYKAANTLRFSSNMARSVYELLFLHLLDFLSFYGRYRSYIPFCPQVLRVEFLGLVHSSLTSKPAKHAMQWVYGMTMITEMLPLRTAVITYYFTTTQRALAAFR